MNDEAVVGATKDPEARQAAAAEREASMDATLAGILGPDDGDDTSTHFDLGGPDAADSTTEPAAEAKSGRERDEHGRYKPKAETAGDETDEPGEPADVAPSADPANSEDYRKALSALNRAKTPQKVLDSMDPADVIVWGQALASEQAKQDGFRKEAEATKAKLEKPTLADLDLDLTEIARPFTDYLGEDADEPVQALTRAILERVHAQMAPLQESLKRQERTAARDRLSKQWSLDDEARWSQVLERRGQDANDYTSESEALTSACRHCFADEVIADYAAKLNKQHDARANGQTTTSTRGRGPSAPKSAADLNDDLINAIQDGDEKKAKAISAQMRNQVDPWQIYTSEKRVGMP